MANRLYTNTHYDNSNGIEHLILTIQWTCLYTKQCSFVSAHVYCVPSNKIETAMIIHRSTWFPSHRHRISATKTRQRKQNFRPAPIATNMQWASRGAGRTGLLYSGASRVNHHGTGPVSFASRCEDIFPRSSSVCSLGLVLVFFFHFDWRNHTNKNMQNWKCLCLVAICGRSIYEQRHVMLINGLNWEHLWSTVRNLMILSLIWTL